MSQPERLEIHDPRAYRAKLRDKLAGRAPLEVLAETDNLLTRLVASAPAATFRARPFSGKWTPLEVLGHLVDTELVFAYRTRAILCDDRPPLVGMDQEKWVAEQGHNQREPETLLRDWRALREMNLALWKTLTPSQLERVGIHSERGEESLETVLMMAAGHDRSHIEQIQRYLNAAREA